MKKILITGASGFLGSRPPHSSSPTLRGPAATSPSTSLASAPSASTSRRNKALRSRRGVKML
ncbi:MAG: NAD(P)-dependent oxidoreductase [Bacteroidales bacterium]|nr:NAD(P)-dependent oxidoreductase [Candidatus Colicola faecequi]